MVKWKATSRNEELYHNTWTRCPFRDPYPGDTEDPCRIDVFHNEFKYMGIRICKPVTHTRIRA